MSYYTPVYISVHESQFGKVLDAKLDSLRKEGYDIFTWGAMDKDGDIWSDMTIKHTSLSREKIEEDVKKALEGVKYVVE